MSSYIANLYRLFHRIFTRPSPSLQLPSRKPGYNMMAYTCVVSVHAGTAPEDASAHHVHDKNGRLASFANPHASAGTLRDTSLLYGLSVFIRHRLAGRLPVPDTSNAKIPIVKPSFAASREGGACLRTTWLGHASYLVEFPSGFRAIFDPVFEERYSAIGPKRFTPAACSAADIPELDAVFISHNHHDHLSLPSLKELVGRFPNLHIFVGRGLAKWFHDSGFTTVTEMDWWDDAEVVLQKPTGPGASVNNGKEAVGAPEQIKARVSCLPSQHGSLRSGFDYGHTLWASWGISSGGKSVWFAGDTGYRWVPEGIEELGPGFDELPRNPQFAQIGELRGPFDVGLIPIGAYHPRFMYSGVHASPYDAVEIFQDTRCKKALAMHWGTFALTSEPVEEPPLKLRQALKLKGLDEIGLFDVCAVGESRSF